MIEKVISKWKVERERLGSSKRPLWLLIYKNYDVFLSTLSLREKYSVGDIVEMLGFEHSSFLNAKKKAEGVVLHVGKYSGDDIFSSQKMIDYMTSQRRRRKKLKKTPRTGGRAGSRPASVMGKPHKEPNEESLVDVPDSSASEPSSSSSELSSTGSQGSSREPLKVESSVANKKASKGGQKNVGASNQDKAQQEAQAMVKLKKAQEAVRLRKAKEKAAEEARLAKLLPVVIDDDGRGYVTTPDGERIRVATKGHLYADHEDEKDLTIALFGGGFIEFELVLKSPLTEKEKERLKEEEEDRKQKLLNQEILEGWKRKQLEKEKLEKENKLTDKGE